MRCLIFALLVVYSEACCVHTIGYWKNHLNVWTDYHNNYIECCYPNSGECVNYTWRTILQANRQSVTTDGEWRWIKLARQYVAAQLGDQVLTEGDSCKDIVSQEDVDRTDTFLESCEITNDATQEQELWDRFNNGQLNGTYSEN
jgi:hypothetical protein